MPVKTGRKLPRARVDAKVAQAAVRLARYVRAAHSTAGSGKAHDKGTGHAKGGHKKGGEKRKPEFVGQARERVQTVANADLDPMPLLGCLDLLLGNVKDADRHFAVLRDPDLQAWFMNHPDDRLAAQCEYCRAWLERDVLPGYRDGDASVADLDAWFADRDVQGFVDRLDRKASRQIGSDDMTLAWATAGDASLGEPTEPAESDQAVDSEDADATSLWQQRWVRPTAAARALI